MMRLSAADALGQRMARQGLVDRHSADVASAARLVCGLQAQELSASRLAIRARTAAVDEVAVARACDTDRSVVRTWLMRGTIHLVAAEDLHWMVALFGPKLISRSRSRWRQLGVSDDLRERSLDVLPSVLADGPLDRHEIAEALNEAGLGVPADPQAPIHMLLHACLTGLVCRGPDRGRDTTFVLTEDWVPPSPTYDEPEVELARRYFRAFSPATTADFGLWSGIGAVRAVTALRDELTPVEVDGRSAWTLGTVEPQSGVRLLPMWDTYLLGYQRRDLLISPDELKRIYSGGIIKASVVEDGAIVGTWTLARRPARVTVTLFKEPSARLRTALDAEAADIGRFLGTPAELSYSP